LQALMPAHFTVAAWALTIIPEAAKTLAAVSAKSRLFMFSSWSNEVRGRCAAAARLECSSRVTT
jgi:hypothetical protein